MFFRYFEWHGQYGHLEHFKSFLTNFGYAYCVFTSLSHIRREVDKMLFRSGTSQGNRAYVKTYMPADCWNYISSFFKNHANIFAYEKVQRKLCTKVSTFDLTQKKVRLITALELVDASNILAIKKLCKLFGQSFGVGVRKAFPMVNLPTINMGSGDTLNIVSLGEGNKDKITFRYNSVASHLSIVLKYTYSVYGSAFMAQFGKTPQLEFISPDLQSEEESNTSALDILHSYLMVNNRVYRVAGVSTNSVRIVPTDEGSETSIIIPANHANELIDEYNL